MATEYSAITNQATNGMITGETYIATETMIQGSCTRGSFSNTNIGLEILDNSDAVVKRKDVELDPDLGLAATASAQVTGLTPGTTYRCRMYRSDAPKADI